MAHSNKLQKSKNYIYTAFETTGKLANADQLSDYMRDHGQLRTVYVTGDTYYYYFQKEFISKKELKINYECKIMKANKPELHEKDLNLFGVDGWQLVVIVPMVRKRAFYYHFIRVVF